MKKILIPTDFSKTALIALEYAIEMTDKLEGELIVLNTYDVPYGGASTMVNIDDLLRQESIEALNKLKIDIKERFPDVNISYKLIAGPFLDIVTRFSKEIGSDLIVMGTTGANGIEGALFGSNTSNLLKNTNIPIITVPRNSKPKIPKSITISTDLKIALDAELYNPVRLFVLGFGAKLNFLNITKTNDQEKLKEIEAKFGMPVDFVFGETVEDGIKDYLSTADTDLVVIVAEKHSFFNKIFTPSVSKKLVQHLKVPMMLLKQ